MKTPEQMAEEYVAHNRSYPYDPFNAQDRYMRNSYLVGYKAGYESLREEIHALTSQLQQANGMVMKLEAER